ncbi:hypothetical protein FRB99_006328 [Tulasnella sp. 403]|nr:hypothetical protein FRB99_006328 [Tulasnella sp. 403]
MNPAGPAQPPQLPKLTYDHTKVLPVAQLRSLKTHFHLLQLRIQDLLATVHGYGNQIGPPWPDILTKYNNILQQTALISEQLTTTVTTSGSIAATLAASQAQSAQWPRPPHNQLPNLLLHPTLPVPQEMDFFMGSFLQTSRPPEVLAADEAAVARFEKEREAQGQNAATPQDILNDMLAIREQHDNRAARALRAVHLLRDRYHWKARPDFAALEQAEENQGSGENEEAEDEVEGHIVVERAETPPTVVESGGAAADAIIVDDDDDKPLDPDDDLFEEVA